MADFTVSLEVQPQGGVAGTRAMAGATRELTAETRKSGEENRRARTSITELQAAETRRIATLAQVAQSIRAQSLALAQAKVDIDQYHRKLEAATAAKRQATQSILSMRNAFFALQGVLATLGLGALVRDSVGVALAFDRASKSIGAATGSQQAAGREMAFVREEADRLGLSLTSTAETYAGVANAAKGTVLQGQAARDIFIGVSEAATVLGKSADDTRGILLGVQQTISKGKVTSEELVQQISERLPGAYQAMADSLGLSTAQLGKRLEQGKVGLKDLVGWAEELRKRFGSGLTDAVNSFQANLNRLGNMADELKRSLGEGFLSGFLAGFSDLRKAMSAEELKAAARDLGETLGKGLRTAADALMLLAKNLELVKAALLAIVALKAASWFVALAQAIVTATGATVTFKAATLATAGPLAAIGVALLALIVVMQKYIMTSRLAMETELSRVAKSQEVFGYYRQLQANKVGLTEAEAAYAVEVRKTMEAELAGLRVSLARTEAQLRAAQTRNPLKYAQVAGPGRNALREQMQEQAAEVKALENQLNILAQQWDRLGKLPVIKTPIDPAADEKAAKLAAKLQDLLEGFRRTAEQAERMAAANKEGTEAARTVAEAIERENAAYQALHSLEGLSAAAKAKLSAVIEGLVGRTQDATRASAEYQATTERDLAYTNAAREAEARLADARAGGTQASRDLAAAVEAEAIATAAGRQEEQGYVETLTSALKVRAEYLRSIEAEIAAGERSRQWTRDLEGLLAQLEDAQRASSVATREHAVELEAERLAIAEGVAAWEPRAAQLRQEVAERAAIRSQIEQQIAAQDRLNASQARDRQVKAEFADWQQQTAAIREYGSEIAEILAQHGLLSDATRELARQEAALAILRSEGGEAATQEGFLRLLAIEAELEGQEKVFNNLTRIRAQHELMAHVWGPFTNATQQAGEMLQDAILDRLVDGELDIERLWKSMERMFLQAVAEMVKRWILAHRAMQAEAARTGAVNAAATSGGAGGGIGSNLTGGSSMFSGAGSIGNLFGGGAYGGGTAGGFAAVGAWAAVFAVVYFGVKQWIKTAKDHMAEVTFRLQEDVGGAVFDVRGNSDAMKALTDQVQAAGKIVVDWLKSLGAVIEGTASGAVTIGREGQGKNTSWYAQLAGGVREWFASQEEAFDFAMVQALKAAEIKGLDPLVLAAIKNSTAKTMEELQKGLADVLKVASFGTSGLQVDFRGITAEMDRLRESMRLLLGPGAALEVALAKIAAQEVLLLQTQRDAIVGKQRTAEEEYQLRLAEAQVWNAELAMRKANVNLAILEQKAKIEAYKGTLLLIRGGEGGGGGRGAGRGGGGIYGLATAFAAAASVVATATAALTGEEVDPALKAMQDFLKGLEDLAAALGNLKPIDPSEIVPPGTTEQTPGGGRRGGGGGRDLKAERRALEAEVASWKMGEVARALQETGQWFADFKERIKDLGYGAEKTAKLIAEAAAELARRNEEIKKTQLGASRDFINAGTAAGGPLISALNANRESQLKLQQGNRDLVKNGLLSQKEMRELNKALHEAGQRQRDQMIGSAADQLFLDLYGLLGDEQKAAELRYRLTLAELDLRREELRLAMLSAHWTAEQMEAVLGPLGDLIQQVRDAGPGLFGGGGGANDNTPPPRQGPAGYRDQYGVFHWTDLEAQAAEAAAERMRTAQEILARRRSEGVDAFHRDMQAVEDDFAIVRAAMGNTREVATEYALAIERVREQYLESLQAFYQELSGGATSGLTVDQQYNAAMAQYSQLLAAVQGGDLSQSGALAEVGQQLMALAGQMFGTSTGGYQELRDAILAQLQAILGITAPAHGPGLTAGGGGLPSGGGIIGGLDFPAPSGSGFAASAPPDVRPELRRGVDATDRVADVVDLSSRRQEGLLNTLIGRMDHLNEKIEDLRTNGAAPQTGFHYGTDRRFPGSREEA